MPRWFLSAYVLLIIAVIPVICNTHFGYDSFDELGPEKWSSQFKACAGKYQSPIDIDEKLVTKVSFPALKFSGIRQLPWTATLQNNGHTAMLKLNSTKPIQISGGPLTSTYSFEQLHFHWGVNDSEGSEDTINHKSFPMELHQVYFNTKYGNFKEALNNPDGLVVLASFFMLSEVDNRAYAELVDGLKRIEDPDSSVTLPYILPLEYLLPINRERYYTYHGSLTTPPCLEVVKWIDFKHPVLISESQLQKFRNLQGYNGPLTHNARPIQPLHGRQVLYNFEDRAVAQPTCSILAVNIILLLLYGCNY